MSNIVVSGPDGSTFTFPEGTDEQTITGALQQHYGAQSGAADAAQQPKNGLATDAVKSVPGGLLQGLSDLLSASGKAGAIETGMDQDQIPDSDQSKQLLEQNVTGQTYKPETWAGDLAYGTARVLGNPASYMGPGGPVRAAASSIAAKALSEAGSKGAALVGASPGTQAAVGIGAAALAPTFGGGSSIENGVGTAAVKAAADKGYNAFRNSGAQGDALSLARWAQAKKAALDQSGLDSDMAPMTNKALDAFATGKAAKGGLSVDASELNKMRVKLNEISQQKQMTSQGVVAPTSDAKAARTALSDYTDAMSQSIIPGTGNMPTGALMQLLSDANKNWSAYRTAQGVDTAVQRGINNAAVANSGRNAGNAIATQIKNKFGLPDQQRSFNSDEVDRINSIVRPGWGQSILRTSANKLGGGGGLGSTMLHAASEALGLGAGGPLGLVGGAMVGHGLTGIGSLLRNKYNNNVKNAADLLAASVLARSPAGQSAGMRVNDQALQVLLAKRAMNAMLQGRQSQ